MVFWKFLPNRFSLKNTPHCLQTVAKVNRVSWARPVWSLSFAALEVLSAESSDPRKTVKHNPFKRRGLIGKKSAEFEAAEGSLLLELGVRCFVNTLLPCSSLVFETLRF